MQRISEGSQEHSNDEDYDDLLLTKSIEKKARHITALKHKSQVKDIGDGSSFQICKIQTNQLSDGTNLNSDRNSYLQD